MILGNTSTITVTIYDANGSLADDANVTFTTDFGAFTENNSSTYTTMTSGSNATAHLNASSEVSVITVTANVTSNNSINDTTNVCFQCNESARNIDLTVTPSVCRADNDHTPLVLARVTDYCGNPKSDTWVDFTFNDSADIYKQKTNTTGYARFNISATAAVATYNITATINGTTITDTATVTFQPANLQLLVAPEPSVVAYQNYGDTTVTKNSTIHLRLSYADVNGAKYALSNTLVNITTTNGTLGNGTVDNVTHLTTTTDSNGRASVNFTSFNGTLTTATNVTITANATVNSTFEPTVNGSALIIVKGAPFLEVTTTYDPPSLSEAQLPHILNVTHTIIGKGELGENKPIDVIFVMDSSGSMDWNDPDDLRIAAAKNFVGKMNATDQAGVVDFDADAVLTQTLVFTDASGKASVNASLDEIDSSGNTAIYDGMHVATDEYACTLVNQYNLTSLLSGVTNTSLEANVTAAYPLSVESTHPYSNNYDNTWTICPEPGATAIRVNFTVNLNSGDYLYFYNANNESLGRCSYRWENNTQWSAWVQGDTIRIRLVTDGSGTDWGFKAYYAEVADNLPIESSHGRETDPYRDSGYYDGYMRDADYYTNLTIPGATAVRIKFRENLDYEDDRIYFYDGSDNPLGWIDWNWQSTTTYTDMLASPWAEGDTIKIRFTSGDNTKETDYGYKGYYVEYLTSGVPVESTHGFHTDMIDNGSPYGYPHECDYNWTLQVPGAEYIRAYISDYNLDDGDYFYMYDQNGTVLPGINGWSYNHDGNSFWTPWVSGDTILTRLVSDSDGDTDYGFRIGDWQTGASGNPRDSVRIEILLTDGETNSDDYDGDDEIQRAIDNGIRVYTVGLTGDVNEDELRNIADQTGGKYYKAEDASALDPIFEEIYTDVQAIANGMTVNVHLAYEDTTAQITRGRYINGSTTMSFTDYNETTMTNESFTTCLNDTNLDCSPTLYNGSDYQQLQFNVNKSIGVNDTLVISYQLWVNSTGDVIIGGSIDNIGELIVPGIGSGYSIYTTDPPDSDPIDNPPTADFTADSKWQSGIADPDFIVNPGDAVTFDGSSSWDDLAIVNHTWLISEDGVVINASGVISGYPGTYVYSNFTNTTATYTINLTVRDISNHTDTESKTLKVTNSCSISLSASPTEIYANGGSSNLTATLTNGTGSPIQGVTITFSQPLGTFGIFNSSTDTTDSAGDSMVLFTAGNTIGIATVKAATPGSATTQPWFYAASDSTYYNYDDATTNITILPSGQITLS